MRFINVSRMIGKTQISKTNRCEAICLKIQRLKNSNHSHREHDLILEILQKDLIKNKL